MIGIVNYGMGNLASVANALEFIGESCIIITAPGQLEGCDRAILPGVGAFGEAMRKITDLGFADALREFSVVRQKPVLGICLGMQLLLGSSVEYGLNKGLGFVSGDVRSLANEVDGLVVPHVGWNDLCLSSEAALMEGIDVPERVFYFVHSYYCQVKETSALVGKTNYGVMFDAHFEAGNLFGVQYHPEKSQGSGLKVLQNFARI